MILELSDTLTKQHVEHTVVPHTRTHSAMAEAFAVRVAAHEVAKTVVVVADHGYVRAVVPGSDRLDLQKLRRAIDSPTKPRLATEAELGGAYPGFELGAVPPFGGPSGDRWSSIRVSHERTRSSSRQGRTRTRSGCTCGIS